MGKKKYLLFYCLIFSVSVLAGDDVYSKLSAELKKYAVVHDDFNSENFPILSGNAEMGGLNDLLGRGVYNIEMNDLYLNKKDRITGAGMMLKIAKFSGLSPKKYFQKYDLEDGILTTEVEYHNGAYQSETFFSQDDKELFVFILTNTGNSSLTCNIDLGEYRLNLTSKTETSLYAVSNENAFSHLQYFLKTNIPFDGFFHETISPYLTVKPGQQLKIVVRLRVNSDKIIQDADLSLDTGKLVAAQKKKWNENWQSMGVIILPDGDYAKTFYRSLHWLQCTAGGANNLPGECQFGVFTSKIAAEYQFRGEAPLNKRSWEQNPFTYGAAGWSALAYTFLGNEAKAGTILANLYRPDAFKKNINIMFPSGNHNLRYDGKEKGTYNYLSHENPDAICFAHEMLYDRTSKGLYPYEMQIHLQGFAPAMYERFSEFYNGKSDTVYQVLRGSAEFWSTILNYDEARKTVSLPPVLSLTEDLFEADLLDGLLAAKWTLTQAAEFAEKRNLDENLRKKWLDIARHIRFADKDGVYLEFRDDDRSRKGAGYMGIRAYAYLGFPVMELMKGLQEKKIRKSLDQCWLRNKKGEGMITFIANWFALTDAFWGRAEEAYEKSSYCLTQIDASGTAMCEQNKYLYYFLTGYSSFVLVPVSMVLQSVDDEIRVFPAVPKAFENIEFYNLPAIDGIRVSGIMKNGNTQNVKFEKDGKVIREIDGKNNVSVKLKKGKLIDR